MQFKKELQEQKSLQECTFQPNIITNDRVGRRKSGDLVLDKEDMGSPMSNEEKIEQQSPYERLY